MNNESASNYTLNVIPSQDDYRDHDVSTQLSLISIPVPKTLDYRPDLLAVRNQYNQGACYAFACATMKEWHEKMDYGLNEYLSPQFFYNHRKNSTQSGMNSRDVMKLLQTIGFCFESNYRYGKKEALDKITLDLYNEAKNHLIHSYAKINTIQDLKKSLVLNGPCLLAVPVYNLGIRMWKKTSSDNQRQGGHAMCIVGYDKNGFIIRNSWGKNWGDKGYCIFPYEDWGLHWEVWTTTDADSVPMTPRRRRMKKCW